jgi:hypothetical protein
MRRWQSLIYNWKENLYLFSLGAFLATLPTSIALLSCAAVTLLIVWILTGEYKAKWNRLIHNKSALLLISIPVLYLAGLCFTHNFSVGLQEFNKSLYWFIFAFVLGSSSPVSYRATCRLFGIYIFVVSVAAGFALLKLLFLENLNFFDFRQVTWIDHIPFSYQIAFVIWLIFYFIFHENLSWVKKFVLFFLIVLLTITLFSLKSFTGYLYFGVMTFTALLLLIWQTKKKLLKFTYLGLLILVTVFPIIYIYHCVQKFYNITEYYPDTIKKFTSAGNRYEHDFNNKMKENGNYVCLFLCEEELAPLWNAHSEKKYNSKTSGGYSLSTVIIRYMTSKGLTKDAEGFAQLSQKDIESIQHENPNYIYAENRLSVYPRIYETIWEIDLYKIYKDPNGKTFSQRIEQALLAGNIIKNNMWFGIGLGNSTLAYEKAIVETGSNLTPQTINSSHNQYLNYLFRFGILGAFYILCVLLWVFFKERKNNPFLLTIFFVSMLAANFGEANWETFIGLNFFAFFFCFLMWITPNSCKQ